MKAKALITGVASRQSLAWSIAQSLHEAGTEIGFSYFGKSTERRITPLAKQVRASFVEHCDMTNEEDLDRLFLTVVKKWKTFDILVHSIAYANEKDLEQPLTGLSKSGFFQAMEVSCYSLISMARRASDMMNPGGAILTLSNSGSQRVIPNYHVMGIAKAALESTAKYLAAELGRREIRVNTLSAGPIRTFASVGIRNFQELLNQSRERSPLGANVSGQDVGELAAFLCSKKASKITGGTYFVDAGIHVLGA